MNDSKTVLEPYPYSLGELIDALKVEDSAKRVRVGFGNPHSWRGDYCELAFEPVTDTTVGQMLAAAESAMGATYEGWKGGDFTMGEDTRVWLAIEGRLGETLGRLLLAFMLGVEGTVKS